MAVKTTIVITHGKESIGTIKEKCLRPASKPHEQVTNLMSILNAINGKDRNAKLTTVIDSGDAVQASGTVTVTGMAAAATVTVAGIVLTAVASGAVGPQFNIGASDTLTAVNLAAAINAQATAPSVSATSALTVVTISAKAPGRVGNFIPLAISAGGSVSGSTLASGVDATTYSVTNTYRLGV
jgi:phage tail sheath gpL-like